MEMREMVPKITRVRDNHEHPITDGYFVSRKICSLCCNDIDEGSWCCSCDQSNCFYSLHISCGELLEFITLSSHLHPLKLILRLDNTTCYYCENSSQNTLMYTCDQCSFYVHLKCLETPLPTISCDNQDHLSFICHGHPMTLVEHDGTYGGVTRYCLACQSPWSSGPAYACQKSCQNVFHKACVEFPQKIERPSYHSRHSLKLQVTESLSCDACYKIGSKLMYFCCDQECNFRLGTECAFLTPIIKWDRHDHILFLIERADCGMRQCCDVCHNSYSKQLVKVPSEVSRTNSFLFRCLECNLNIHFLCGPLPRNIKHESHMHFLTLADSTDEDSSYEYYCNVCEKEGDERFRVYCCVQCKYVAHIHCVVSEIIKALKGDFGNVELLAVGDARWKFNNKEKMVNKEEAGMSTLTLNDIMERLTEAERKKLMNPMGVSSMETYIHHKCDKIREENSGFEHKGDGDDIQRIQNLFNIGLSDLEQSYMDEFWYFNPKDGLKFDERHLKMKVVDVEGYKVPLSLAPVLKTVLHKYGDFGSKSRLTSSITPELKSIATTFLCIVVDRMSTTKVEDITKDVLKDWVFYILSIDRITDFDMDFVYDHFKKLILAFLGFEAIRFQNEMAERLPQQIAELQTQLETSKANLEKLKSIGESTASDVMKQCLRLRSELKNKDACEGFL